MEMVHVGGIRHTRGYLPSHADSFLHCVAFPFHSFVTTSVTQVVQADTFRGVKGLCGTPKVPHQDAREVHEVFFSEQKVAKEVPAVSEVTRFDTFLSQKGSTVSAHAVYLIGTLRRIKLTGHVTVVNVCTAQLVCIGSSCQDSISMLISPWHVDQRCS